jgi:hypothetical protein
LSLLFSYNQWLARRFPDGVFIFWAGLAARLLSGVAKAVQNLDRAICVLGLIGELRRGIGVKAKREEAFRAHPEWFDPELKCCFGSKAVIGMAADINNNALLRELRRPWIIN